MAQIPARVTGVPYVSADGHTLQQLVTVYVLREADIPSGLRFREYLPPWRPYGVLMARYVTDFGPENAWDREAMICSSCFREDCHDESPYPQCPRAHFSPESPP
jgi:hypothetical protein